MTGTLAFAWSLSLIAEAALMFRVWQKVRAAYSSFFLYLLADITAALFLMGVVMTVPQAYSAAWISLELVMAAFQTVISIEAFRRADKLLRFAPRMLLLVVFAALGSTVLVWWLLRAPNPWPSEWLAPANAARATVEMFLGLCLLFLVSLPGRASCLLKFQGRHLMILAVYLIASSILLFLENYLYSIGTALPGALFMFITAGFFATWTFLVPRRAPDLTA